MPAPAASLSPDGLALRRLALRAIMDGRGIEAVILSSPRSLAHYGGVPAGTGSGALLVVTAREARWVRAGGWRTAADLLPPGCALGHDLGHDAEGTEGLAALVQAVRPRRVLCLAADIARQVGGG